jgi:hypothetical protein
MESEHAGPSGGPHYERWSFAPQGKPQARYTIVPYNGGPALRIAWQLHRSEEGSRQLCRGATGPGWIA